MIVHLLGIPHTITRDEFSHCAFTGKVQRFSKMVRAQGIDVFHYGVEGSVTGATEDVNLMTEAEHLALLGHPYHEQPKGFYGDDAVEGSALYRQWNYNARQELMERMRPGDLIALPFGRAHESAIQNLPLLKSKQCAAFESGIGYDECFLPYRVYESEAVRHTIMAKEGRSGIGAQSARLEWVAPNYYDVDDWELGKGGDHIVFLGRLNEYKGVDVILRLAAERDDKTFILCGQGNSERYQGLPNVHLMPPIKGKERSDFLGSAAAIICPSRFVEPFCGVNVEAQLCGTPVISSNFGAFTETVEQDVTGYRCQTLNEWLAALDNVKSLDRAAIRARAIRKYSLEAVGEQYADIISSLRETLTP